MCLNETDKRMCLLTLAKSENTSVGCSVPVALSFCFRTGSRSWCWHVSWQPAFFSPTEHNIWIVYWVLLMPLSHVTNKVVFMFDVCPLNCKPGMYDTAPIRDCTVIIYLIGFWFEFGNGKGVSNGKQQFTKGFRSQVIPNMACRMKPGADIVQARSKFGATINMQDQVQQKKAGPSPAKTCFTKSVRTCRKRPSARGLERGRNCCIGCKNMLTVQLCFVWFSQESKCRESLLSWHFVIVQCCGYFLLVSQVSFKVGCLLDWRKVRANLWQVVKILAWAFNLKLHHTHIWESDSLRFHFAWLKDEQSFRSKFNMFKSLKKLKCLQIFGFFGTRSWCCLSFCYRLWISAANEYRLAVEVSTSAFLHSKPFVAMGRFANFKATLCGLGPAHAS